MVKLPVHYAGGSRDTAFLSHDPYWRGHCGDSTVCHHVPFSIPPGWILVDSLVWYIFSSLSGMNRC